MVIEIFLVTVFLVKVSIWFSFNIQLSIEIFQFFYLVLPAAILSQFYGRHFATECNCPG